MLLVDSAAFALALVIAVLFRLEFNLTPEVIGWIKVDLCLMIPLKLAIFWSRGLYSGMWRYVTVRDVWILAQSAVIATILAWSIIHFVRIGQIPRSVLLMDAVFTFLLTGGLRIAIRQWFFTKGGLRLRDLFSLLARKHLPDQVKRLLVVGAGDASENILREIQENPRLDYEVIGLLDDDSSKQGRSLRGASVLGTIEQMGEICRRNEVDEVFVAIPSATATQMRHIVDQCRATGVPFQTLPGVSEIIDGRVRISDLRDVNFLDLLGRQPTHIDMKNIRGYLEDQVVMITGCGGSIGSELVRQVVRFQPKKIILFEASEMNLFSILTELRYKFNYPNCYEVLGRIQNKSLVDSVLSRYQPKVIFHAAACKHVPLVELNPWEAVFNNVVGSRVVMEAAVKHQVDRFVLVSTDKAVKPTSIMGATKRISEMMLQSLQGNGTRFMAVRFGNVVGSSGSVLPLFHRQIRLGGPVTVTHPGATRYFMTIPEAASLILQAGALGQGGEVFILEMGTPVKIVDMARDLIRLSGKEPDKEIEIIFTGLREGEKLDEELVADDENLTRTNHRQIMVLESSQGQGLESATKARKQKEWLWSKIDELVETAKECDSARIKLKIKEIVPEYAPPDI
ncbi:MAG: polysaccharide biosynthesis protein [Deltaproteobacteria bacterium]|nr:polysaccharide biosynthesis protein [Deltaproteobacteria bacterium]